MTLVSTLALSSSRNKFLPNKKKMMCLTSEDAVYTGNDLAGMLIFHNGKHVVTAASLEASLLPVAFSLSLSLSRLQRIRSIEQEQIRGFCSSSARRKKNERRLGWSLGCAAFLGA